MQLAKTTSSKCGVCLLFLQRIVDIDSESR